MINTSDFRHGLKFLIDGEPYKIIEYENVLRGRGHGFVRTKIKNLKTGATIAKKFNSGESFEEGDFSVRTMQYLYQTGSNYHFMDSETYDQFAFDEEHIGETRWFLMEGHTYQILLFEGTPLELDLPASVELKISETTPGVKGDSVTNIMKEATLETGLTIKVPIFIGTGETVKVDTRTKEYLSRA
ncbi:elongation factor P [bacterium]|nr:elongation factor P [bacterium]